MEKYPEVLYVVEEPMPYPYHISSKQLVGRGSVNSCVPDNGEVVEVAVYELKSITRYTKTVKKIETIVQVETSQSPALKDSGKSR